MTLRKNYIDGGWVDGTPLENRNPSDLSDVVGEYAQASPDDVRQAVAAARAAVPAAAASTPAARAEALYQVGAQVLERSEELGTLLAREEGKTRSEGIGEAIRAGRTFQFFAGEAMRVAGEILPSLRPDIRVEILREPVGVVGIITPWNFPLAIPAWKIAPALAFGNAVVFKPAELVPGCAWELAAIIADAGFAPGVFNLVMGKGASAGEALISDPDVAAVTFTGSTTIGRRVAQTAVSRLAKVQLEMGGKNALLVLEDADLDIAVEYAVQGAFFSTGQRCTASSRLLVTDKVHDAFVEKVLDRLRQLRVGHALEDVDIGPVVSEAQLQKDLEYVAIGKAEGAELAWGGAQVERDTEGFFLEPALFVDTGSDMRINREEIFGPVAAVSRVRDYDEGLAIVNDTDYGLVSAIVTRSLAAARHFQDHAETGMVMVNQPTVGGDYHVPFGGAKQSSYGPREQGTHAREFYTETKTSYVSA